jgi:hypothetical protein
MVEKKLEACGSREVCRFPIYQWLQNAQRVRTGGGPLDLALLRVMEAEVKLK